MRIHSAQLEREKMTIVENDLWKVELELEGGSLSPETAKALIEEVKALREELDGIWELENPTPLQGSTEMDFDAYQEAADETAIYNRTYPLDYLIPALAGETGELAGHYAKALRDDRGVVTSERKSLILKEAGDVLWMLAQIATELGERLSDVAQDNIDKLASRQQRGVLSGSGDLR